MTECTDNRFSEMLHAYELNLLADEDRQQLEIHVLECNHCFEQVRAMATTTDLLTHDQDVRNVINVLASAASEGTAHAPSDKKAKGAGKTNFRRYLLAAALTLCIAIPGYYLLREPDTVQQLMLLPMRSNTPRTLSLETGGIAEINFVLDRAQTDHAYSIAIVSSDADTVFTTTKFYDFDERGMGVIRLPMTKFHSGFYTLSIQDPSAEDNTVLRQYSFKVE